MNIYRYEFKSLLRSLITWAVIIVGLLFLFMMFYPTFGTDAALLDKILENYPEEMLKAFGMNTGLSLSTVPGYFSFVFAFIQLALAIQASNYGFGLLSAEERDMTADFLLTKPVSRTKVFLSKLFAAFMVLLMMNIFVWGAVIGSIEMFRGDNPYDAEKMALLLSSVLLFQLVFLSVGMMISVIVPKVRTVLPYSMGLAFGLYILNALRGVLDGEILGLISPYYHFEPGYILEHGTYQMPVVLVSLIAIPVSLLISYLLYIRRNVRSL